MAAILKFKIAACPEGANVIGTGLIGFLYHKNMGLATEIKPLRVSATEIWAKTILNGGHFEIQDGCIHQWSQYYCYWSN